ncbi:hypothetical protein ALI22I_29580 [Saccharothrix sp. ALI-22-I]|uniref:hypothetical protein n=1 Tax=Saccharothrix sp. ALI-22-I TaxID=1933778 RepID=UPI00097BF2FF|nr:hypothetical protein [Saccharothrix sp. ALI-22-I]ONI84680.1 hypothetical protein ALI22I_29580 [Saccharothrix sp. ALI-22-I]
MTKAQRIAAAWANLPAPELADQVRLLVKARDAASRGVWSAVREDPVIAARVRGALAGLKAEYRGHRDEAMWLVWIAHVQQQLAVPATAPAPVVETPVEDVTPEPAAAEWAPSQEPATPRPPSDAPAVLFQEPLSSSK